MPAVYNVARGPVPRELSTVTKNIRVSRDSDVFSHIRCMARDRPSPYGEGKAFFPVARGPVPRDRWSITKNIRVSRDSNVFSHIRRMARDRPSPYGERKASAAKPPQRGGLSPAISRPEKKRPNLQGFRRFLSHPMLGEGQALALR